jgi:hypothetical protein
MKNLLVSVDDALPQTSSDASGRETWLTHGGTPGVTAEFQQMLDAQRRNGADAGSDRTAMSEMKLPDEDVEVTPPAAVTRSCAIRWIVSCGASLFGLIPHTLKIPSSE